MRRPSTPPEGRSPGSVGDRLAAAVERRRSQLVLGLDPHPERLWPDARRLAEAPDPDHAARMGRAIAHHCRLVLDAAAEHCVAVKPQVACFERWGAPGWTALAGLVADARARDLLVIADAKRGDIDISARVYGAAFFGAGAGEGALEVDWLTASPLLGGDSLGALLEPARSAGGGLFVLVRTSNPGAADLQDLPLADGRTVSQVIAAMVAELGAAGVGASGLSDVGAVVGATAPERIAQLRTAMPHAVMLLPGVGPQGADGAGLQDAFAPGPAGGLLTVSRAIADAHIQAGGDPARAARAAAAALRERVWRMAQPRGAAGRGV